MVARKIRNLILFCMVSVGTLAETVTCAGGYGGHLQGVAADGTNIWWSFTVEVVKTDASGTVLATTGPVASHHGDLCVVDGTLYVAVNLGSFNTENQANSWIYAYRADTLAFVQKWEVPELVHGAGGVTYHDGRFYVVGGLPATGHDHNYVYEYQPGFTFVARHDLPGYTYKGIQTAHFWNGRFWFGIYGVSGNPAGRLDCAADFTDLNRTTDAGAYGLLDWNGRLAAAVTKTSSAGGGSSNTGSIDLPPTRSSGVAPTIGTISATFNARTARLVTGTLTVPITDLGGGEGGVNVQALIACNETFTLARQTYDGVFTAVGNATLALTDVTPGTNWVRVVATAADGASTVKTAVVVASGSFADMCYKPPASQSDYPWTWNAYWFSSPGSSNGLNFEPTFGDDVLLYSSKNVKVPLRVGAGVHAEARALRFANAGWGENNHQAFRVDAGGTMTNTSYMIVGGGEADNNKSGHIQVFGDWATWGTISIGRTKSASSITVEEGGHFANNFLVPENDGNPVSEFQLGDSSTAAENVVTNKGVMEVADLHFCNAKNGYGRFENFGTLRIARKLTLGRKENTHAYFHLHRGGRLEKEFRHSKALLVGFGAGAEGVFEMDDDVTLAGSDWIDLGSQWGSKGTLILNDATLTVANQINAACSLNARGTIELNGASRLRFMNKSYLHVGCYTGCVARVTLKDDSVLDGVQNLYIPDGEGATGVVEVLDRAVLTNIAKRTIILAEFRNTYGELTVGENAYVGPLTNLSVSAVREVPSAAVTMKGGTIGLKGGGGGVWSLYLGNRDQKSCKAKIRGWGRFVRTGSSTDMVRMTIFGQVVADGEGAERDLDFAQVRTVTDNSDNNTTGSNGWYAVNGGRLVYPRIQNVNGDSHRVVGDYPNTVAPRLVNSLRLTMQTYPSAADYHIYAELYATNRTDIPAGLPCGNHDIVKGVWRLGLSSGNGIPAEPVPVAFRGLTVNIRHDAFDIAEDHKMDIWHHDGTAGGGWRRVARSKPFDPAHPVVASETPVEPSSAAWNVGWFAVVARCTSGATMIMLR